MAGTTLAFEIGTEEIPAFDLSAAIKQLKKDVPALLDAKRIPHGDIEVYDTPRRLIVIVHDIPEFTEEQSEVFKGPSVKIAFDDNNEPTKAALGFARGKGADIADIVVEDGYIYVKRIIAAQSIKELLPDVLDEIIHGISWPKSQRWGSEHETFSRPVRWLLALLGDEVIEYHYANLETSNMTRGHRFLAPGPFEVANADALLETLRSAYLIPSETEREAVIREGVAAIEKETGLTAELPAKTLVEVINLAEYPTVLLGTFDEEFLAVPEEIIVDAMLMHQRYFPLYDKNGALTNHFLVVSNGDPACAQTIIEGNERVVRARLYDAKFFYDEDLKIPLEGYVDRLSEVVFQEKLGTMLDKTHRIEKLCEHLALDADLNAEDKADALRAAKLCKADLVTGAVVEFTSVQGVMGAYYAQAAGETEQVATAIGQHYQPRFAGDAAPDSEVGKIVAFADKLDTICGLFALGQGPSGSSDPFALRRSAIGIIAMLRKGLSVSLENAIDCALDSYAADITFDKAAVKAEIIDFFITRTKVILKDEGVASDVIEAIVACHITEPAEISKRAHALETMRKEIPEAMQDLATAFARANNLRNKESGSSVDEALLEQEEQLLLDAIVTAEDNVNKALQADEYPLALQSLADLRNPIDTFFSDVMIMDEDPRVRANRLALLNRFVNVFEHVADFSQLSK